MELLVQGVLFYWMKLLCSEYKTVWFRFIYRIYEYCEIDFIREVYNYFVQDFRKQQFRRQFWEIAATLNCYKFNSFVSNLRKCFNFKKARTNLHFLFNYPQFLLPYSILLLTPFCSTKSQHSICKIVGMKKVLLFQVGSFSELQKIYEFN